MTATRDEKFVNAAARLYELRRTLRFIAGFEAAYLRQIAPHRAILQEARRQNEPLAPIVLNAMYQCDNPYETMRWAAAFLEESESSG